MAKRDPDPEPLDEELIEPEISPVGERLRVAREAKKLSLEDLAAQTRIPQRHLASIESADWDNLPAPTYTVGFAKNYATAVGLDRDEIGNQLREEMGGQRFTASSADVFEPADPARTMPKGLVIGAIAAVIVLVIVMSWLNNRSLQDTGEPDNVAVAENAAAPAPQAAAPAAPPASAQGPVVLTATGPAWIQVTDRGKSLFQGELQAGQAYSVPADATAPMLKAGKPEALRITVGTAVAPQVGPPGKVTTVSLNPVELMKGPAAAAAASAPPAAAPPAPRPRARRSAPTPPPPAPAPAPETPPATNTAG